MTIIIHYLNFFDISFYLRLIMNYFKSVTISAKGLKLHIYDIIVK